MQDSDCIANYLIANLSTRFLTFNTSCLLLHSCEILIESMSFINHTRRSIYMFSMPVRFSGLSIEFHFQFSSNVRQ
jgi:hypothetical protein